MSPWQILGIPYGSSRAIVKEAYARLLKQHRPDRDPAGFRRIRDAYEQLRDVPEEATRDPWEELEDHAEYFDLAHAEPTESDPQGRDEDQPSADQQAEQDESCEREPEPTPPPPARPPRPPFLQRLERALLRTHYHPRHELRVLRVLVHLWGRSPDSHFQVTRLLRGTLHRPLPMVRTLLKPQDLVAELERGRWEITVMLLRVHLASDDLTAASSVATAIESTCARDPSDRFVPLLVEAAGLFAFADTNTSERFLDLGFRRGGEHRIAASDVDFRIGIGHEISQLPALERLLFTRVLLLGPDWHSAEDMERATISMRRRHGRAPLLGQLFRATAPGHWERVIAPAIDPGQAPRTELPPLRPSHSDQEYGEPPARRVTRRVSLAWLLAIMAIGAITRLVLRTPERTPPASFNMPRTAPGPTPEQIRSLLWPGQGNPPVPPPAPGKPAGGR